MVELGRGITGGRYVIYAIIIYRFAVDQTYLYNVGAWLCCTFNPDKSILADIINIFNTRQ